MTNSKRIGFFYPLKPSLGWIFLLAFLLFSGGSSAFAETDKKSAMGVLSGLNDALGGGAEDNLLNPDDAFKFAVDLKKPGFVTARWQVAEGYYLYKKKIKMALESGTGLTLGDPKYPASTRIKDPAFGNVEIFRGALSLDFPILGARGTPDALSLKAGYQGCADLGVCYPPIKKQIDFSSIQLSNLVVSSAQAANNDVIETPDSIQPDTQKVSEQDAIAASLSSGNTLLTLISFFGFGLLLAFTPCVFPMIPILSGIIVGEGENITTRRGFTLALVYVLAMALAYTVVGVLAGLFGANLQIWFQNPWVLSIFAAIFVLLSLSMFGFYELQMPGAIQTKLTAFSNKQESGKLLSAAIMGLLSALIVGPCVTAPLIGALIYIGQTGNAVLGGMALFALSMGMGAPLLLIGASAGKLLPKAGMWMDAVKAVFGVMMIGVAIWLLERILPVSITLLLWGLLLVISGIYMGALRQIPEGVPKWAQLWKGLGFAMLLYGSLQVIGSAAGGGDVLQPLKGVFSRSGGDTGHTESGLVFQQIKGLDGFEQALKQANSTGKTVMLDFYADWCISCKEMEKLTFSDSAVKAVLANTVLLKADVTANDDVDKSLLKHFDIIGPPAILFFNAQGQELRPYRVVGFVAAKKFSKHSAEALAQ